MPHSPRRTRVVTGYIDPRLHQRMKRIAKHAPRYTISRQIQQSLAAHIDALEIVTETPRTRNLSARMDARIVKAIKETT